MEHANSDRKEEFQHDNNMPCSVNNSSELEQDDLSGFTISELEIEFEKMCNKLVIPNYIRLISPHKDFSENCTDYDTASDPVSIFYRRAALFSIPVNLRSSESQKNQQRWMFESKEANLLFKLGVRDDKRRHFKSPSADLRLTKSSELCSLPSVLRENIGRQSSEFNISERKLVSCSKGLLCCVWKSEIPFFVFSFENHSSDLYLAYPQKVESSFDKSLDYVYLFHSIKSKNHRNNASSVIGKMTVSSSFVLDSNGSKLLETEFVLFGTKEDYFKEIESSSFTLNNSKGFSKKITEVLKSRYSFKHKALHKFGEPNFNLDDFERGINEMDNVNDFVQASPSNLELAAIVVKDYQCNRSKEPERGGWGLKFLKNYEGGPERKCGDSRRKIDVLVPSGFHGGPINGSDGPSGLIERWKFGSCDCGGWDIGCPLKVLENNSLCSTTLIQDDSEEDRQPVCLFMKEGAQQSEPTLRMMNKSKDMYCIDFESSLSILQSFSTAVAIIHCKTPDLYPKF
ncbi:uncharacterized protein A4U43_C04F1770 [Asparagus officinalis]|uniref:Uncharacterized protein n=1 Tax=Asparagus officinalis TaxID=4686 RepID=A0A5P1F2Y5_ASPOF|nr:uncharacterized protein LOC109836411 [Asparagus officinalis]XP_020259893.1 uncharacterized protein LOC109836411 [Asparagus officinalis]ONK70810.1 uncharacterized protein A4U43_C04F1770 [Asparagus officinalis]